ncbi:octopamine receptor beta-2R-like [Haliotis asinina]|uniref:octopamine receptor beta-2R-like n=1 Tax=Haliotis asinina TaxID=109174 RepID=UPI003531D043
MYPLAGRGSIVTIGSDKGRGGRTVHLTDAAYKRALTSRPGESGQRALTMSDLTGENLTNVSSTWSAPPGQVNEGNDSLETLVLVIKCIIMVAIMVGAVFGNVLVISSVIKFERLRAITNYFIVSLAFADLLVAILVMPFSASMELSGKWVLGRTMCDIFNGNDVLFSTASILHLCCISMDRYIAIIHPLQYENKMTRHRVAAMLTTTWVASILISCIPVHSQLYTTVENYQKLEHDHETCTFIVNKVYAGVSSCVSFWIPCFIMVFVYAKIYMEARKQEKFIQSTAMYMQYSDARDCHSNGTLRGGADGVPRLERKRMKREHKAAKTLGVIMGAFILCFLPFFSWYVITTMCDESCPYPPVIGSMLFWIGYFNSCLNPILYAYFNRDFRTAFKKLLRIESMIPCDGSDPTTQALNTAYTDMKKNSGADIRMSTSSAGRIS